MLISTSICIRSLITNTVSEFVGLNAGYTCPQYSHPVIFSEYTAKSSLHTQHYIHEYYCMRWVHVGGMYIYLVVLSFGWYPVGVVMRYIVATSRLARPAVIITCMHMQKGHYHEAPIIGRTCQVDDETQISLN